MVIMKVLIGCSKKTKDIKAWSQASPEPQPFVWYTVDDLKRKIKVKKRSKAICELA
jgi:hypothetical protein